jgi:hypothetical protein
MALQFRFFLANDFSLLFTLFWLFLAAISGFVYFTTAFIAKPQTAVFAGFIVFLVRGGWWRDGGMRVDWDVALWCVRSLPNHLQQPPANQHPTCQAGWTFQGIVTYGLPYTPTFYFEPHPDKLIFNRIIFWIFTVLPWNPLVKAILDMAAATNTNVHPGLRWEERNSYCMVVAPGAQQPDFDPLETWKDLQCIFPVGSCFVTLAVQFVAYTVLAIWLDNVMPNELGVSRHPFFFLRRAFWRPRRAQQGEALARLLAEGEARLLAEKKAAKRVPNARMSVAGGPDEDEDVGEESFRIKQSLTQKLGGLVRIEESEWLGLGRPAQSGGSGGYGGPPAPGLAGLSQAGVRRRSSGGGAAIAAQAAAHRQWQLGCKEAGSKSGAANYAVEVFGLRKVFRQGWWARNAPKALGGKPNGRDFWAIKDSWFGIEQGSLFCLLGPNGAGKTTTINCLTGGWRF